MKITLEEAVLLRHLGMMRWHLMGLYEHYMFAEKFRFDIKNYFLVLSDIEQTHSLSGQVYTTPGHFGILADLEETPDDLRSLFHEVEGYLFNRQLVLDAVNHTKRIRTPRRKFVNPLYDTYVKKFGTPHNLVDYKYIPEVWDTLDKILGNYPDLLEYVRKIGNPRVLDGIWNLPSSDLINSLVSFCNTHGVYPFQSLLKVVPTLNLDGICTPYGLVTDDDGVVYWAQFPEDCIDYIGEYDIDDLLPWSAYGLSGVLDDGKELFNRLCISDHLDESVCFPYTREFENYSGDIKLNIIPSSKDFPCPR